MAKRKAKFLGRIISVYQAIIGLDHPNGKERIYFGSLDDTKLFRKELGKLIKSAESSVGSMKHDVMS